MRQFFRISLEWPRKPTVNLEKAFSEGSTAGSTEYKEGAPHSIVALGETDFPQSSNKPDVHTAYDSRRGVPVSVSPGTPRLSELSLMKASVELVNVCGDSVRSWPLSESNRSKVAVLPPLPATSKNVTFPLFTGATLATDLQSKTSLLRSDVTRVVTKRSIIYPVLYPQVVR